MKSQTKISVSELNLRSLHTLEYDKILSLLEQSAICEDGKRLARELMPMYSAGEVKAALELTGDALHLLNRKGGVPIVPIKNVTESALRAEKGASLSLRELLDVASVLRCARKLDEYVDNTMAGLTIKGLFDALCIDKFLEDSISAAIISEEEIADTASPELASIRRSIDRCVNKAKDILSGIIRSQRYQKCLQESIVTMRGDRYVIPVKAEYRSEVSGLVHDISGSGSTLFIEPIGVVEANNELRVLRIKEAQEIERIIAELSAIAGDHKNSLIADCKLIAEIDLLFAKAKLAGKMKAVKPIISDKGRVKLINARHPLITKDKVVPINVELGYAFDMLIVTGPNTGGKTVTLKTVGLFTLMAQAGMFIPCDDESCISVFENVLADIGDEQSIELSLSTFSSHMANIVKILDVANDSSLLLFDELCAGTDPVEGAALAIAILEQAKLFGAKVLATTHYAELKTYAIKTKRVENASCEFNVETLSPTYRLMIGIPGKSNAFAISGKLGLSDYVIENAKKLIDSEVSDFESVLSDLEVKRKQMEDEKEESAKLRAELSALRDTLAAEKAKFDIDKDKEIQKARVEAKRVLSSAKRMYEDVVSELEALKKQKDKENFSASFMGTKASVSKKIGEIDDAVDPVKIVADENYVLPRALVKGDTVIMVEIGKEVTVLEPVDAKGYVTVTMGAVKTKVSAKSLRLVEKPKKKQPQTSTRVIKSSDKGGSMDLDLRGQTSDEALYNLDKFLDQAAMSGITQVCVIHGKGTGALRSAITSFLKSNPYVKASRLGVYGEGDSGVTIVTLK